MKLKRRGTRVVGDDPSKFRSKKKKSLAAENRNTEGHDSPIFFFIAIYVNMQKHITVAGCYIAVIRAVLWFTLKKPHSSLFQDSFR